MLSLTALFLAANALAAHPAMAIQDDGKSLTVTEKGKPVAVYHYALVPAPDGVDPHFRREAYIHPLYGLDGEVMTEDFPKDHYHHRGVFWAWPGSTVGGKKIDVWALDGAREIHESFLKQEVTDDTVTLAARSAWVFDAEPDKPKMREEVWMTVHKAEKKSRAIDFRLTFENVSGEEFVFGGATTDNKGYGGFGVRPDSARKPFTFTCATGTPEQDVLEMATPWADVTYATKPDGKKVSGMAIFQHPANPGYPHRGWIFRHYGFLGQSWPHRDLYKMKPGEKVELRYRLLLHRGTAESAGVTAAFQSYEREMKK